MNGNIAASSLSEAAVPDTLNAAEVPDTLDAVALFRRWIGPHADTPVFAYQESVRRAAARAPCGTGSEVALDAFASLTDVDRDALGDAFLTFVRDRLARMRNGSLSEWRAMCDIYTYPTCVAVVWVPIQCHANAMDDMANILPRCKFALAFDQGDGRHHGALMLKQTEGPSVCHDLFIQFRTSVPIAMGQLYASKADHCVIISGCDIKALERRRPGARTALAALVPDDTFTLNLIDVLGVPSQVYAPVLLCFVAHLQSATLDAFARRVRDTFHLDVQDAENVLVRSPRMLFATVRR